jgi:hypothetical protein
MGLAHGLLHMASRRRAQRKIFAEATLSNAAAPRASTRFTLATISSSFQRGVGMSEKLNAEYEKLCDVEVEAEERALNATK